MVVFKMYSCYTQGPILGLIACRNSPVLLVELHPTPSENVLLCIVAVLENIFFWNVKLSTIHMIFYGRNYLVTSFCLDDSETCLAVGYSNGVIKLWNLLSRNSFISFHGHTSAVKVLKFSPNGLQLASGGHDTNIILWDVVNESGLYRLRGHKSMITTIVFLSDNYLVSTSKDCLIKVWDLFFMTCFHTIIEHSSEILSNVLIQNVFMITGTKDGRILLFQKIPNVDQVCNFSNVNPKFAEFQNDCVPFHFIFLGFIERTSIGPIIKLFYIHLLSVVVAQSERSFDFFLFSSTEIDLPLYDSPPTTLKIPSVPCPSDIIIHKYTFLSSHKKVSASNMYIDNFGRILFVLNLADNHIEICKLDSSFNFSPLFTISHFHSSDVRCLSFSSDSELLAAGSSDGIRIWSSSTEQLLTYVSFTHPLSCCFIPGDRYVVSGTKFGIVHLIDINLSTLVQSVQFHSDAIWSIVLQPHLDGVASCSSDRSLKLLSLRYVSSGSVSEKVSLEEQCSYILPEDSLLMKYSPDGKYLAVSLLDNTIKIFLVRTMVLYLNLYGHKLPVLGFDISHEGSILVSGSADKTIKVWGLDFGNCLRSIFSHEAIMSVAFVPNTHLIFSSSRDGQIKLLDIEVNEEIFQLSGHQACIWSMVVSHDGNILATSSHDMSLRLWRKCTEQVLCTEKNQEKDTMQNDSSFARTLNTSRNTDSIFVYSSGCSEISELVDRFIACIEDIVIFRGRESQEFGYSNYLSRPVASDYTRRVSEIMSTLQNQRIKDILFLLPLTTIINFVVCVNTWIDNLLLIEVLTRIVSYIVCSHHVSIYTSNYFLSDIDVLYSEILSRMCKLRNLLGFNAFAVLHFLD